jgi:hypothetical protein
MRKEALTREEADGLFESLKRLYDLEIISGVEFIKFESLKRLYDLEIISGVEFIKFAYRLGKGEEDES